MEATVDSGRRRRESKEVGHMEAIIEYLGGAKFSAEARGHRVVSDQPFENSGTDMGMTPPELLLASLGTCAGYYAAQYLRARSLPMRELKIRVSGGKAAQPARLGSFQITVSAPGVEGRHRDGLIRAVRSCLIHQTLEHRPLIDLRIEVPLG
jgi:putative redox protein